MEKRDPCQLHPSEDECEGEFNLSAEGSNKRPTLQNQTTNTGVSGGTLYDSTALGVNNGEVKIHNTTYNINMDVTDIMTRRLNSIGGAVNSVAKDRERGSDDQNAKEELVHSEKGDPMTASISNGSDTVTQHASNSSNDGSFKDCISGQRFKESDSAPMSEGTSLRQMKHAKHDDSYRVELQLADELKIHLRIASNKLEDGGSYVPGHADLAAKGSTSCGQGLKIFAIDLKKIKHVWRMNTAHNIEMTVKIAKYDTIETENIYHYLETLYNEVIGNCETGDGTPRPSTMIQPHIETNFDTVVINLDDIPHELFQTLAKHNVDYIVFLAEYSPDKTIPIHEFVSRTYIRLARVAMCTL